MQDALIDDSARVVGLYSGGRQIGFSRTVTDGHVHAYLADVYVLEEFRGRGLGAELVRFSVAESPFGGCRWILHTADAHGLYRKFGFGEPDDALDGTSAVMSDPARRQLAALARIDEQFRETGIDYWLFGGWGVDFYAGAVTRPHDDVDIAIWLDDLARIVELLETDGWCHAPYPDGDGGTGYERDGVRLELTFLVRREDGGIYMPFGHGYVRWPDETLSGLRDRAARNTGARGRARGSGRDEVVAERRRCGRGEGSGRLRSPARDSPRVVSRPSASSSPARACRARARVLPRS